MTGRGREAPATAANSGPTRRTMLGAALALAAASPARAAPAARVASLDWALAATLVALGAPPLAIGEPGLYARWVAEPALPPGIEDLGLRAQPNLERLAGLAPDLILINPLIEPARPALERIAPTLGYDPFAGGHPLAGARAAAGDLGARIGRPGAADALLARTEAAFDAARDALARGGTAPLLLASFRDGRHLTLHGAGSLLDDVLARLGLANAWDRPTGPWGTSLAAIEDLAAYPAADLVVLEPVPDVARAELERPGLWTGLRAARTGRMVRLPPVWAFGDVTAAARFAGLLAEALTRAPAR